MSKDDGESLMLCSRVTPGAHSREAASRFDLEFEGISKCTLRTPPASTSQRPGIGVVVGPSGSGKTSLLRRMAHTIDDGRVICEWRDGPSDDDLLQCPRVVDEFTSSMDRVSAKMAAVRLREWFADNDGWTTLIVASAHEDILPFIRPAWVWFTKTAEMVDGDRIPRVRVCREGEGNLAHPSDRPLRGCGIGEESIVYSVDPGGNVRVGNTVCGRVCPNGRWEIDEDRAMFGPPDGHDVRDWAVRPVNGIRPRQTHDALWERLACDAPAFRIGVVVLGAETGARLTVDDIVSVCPQYASVDGSTRTWDPMRCVMDQMEGCTTNDRVDRLICAGLSSVPSWFRPYHVLSNGERQRVDVAMDVRTRGVVGGVGTLVDPMSARSMAACIGAYVRASGIHHTVVLTTHADVAAYIRADWAYSTDEGVLRDGPLSPLTPLTVAVHPNAYEMRAQWNDRTVVDMPSGRMQVLVQRCSRTMWTRFREHHYLSDHLMISSRCYLGSIDGVACAFVAVAASPGLPWGPTKANPRTAKRHAPGKARWREARLVVMPEFQGLGVGKLVSETVARIFVSSGHQYYSRTSHPKLTRSRTRSDMWTPYGTSAKVRRRTEWPSNSYAEKGTRRAAHHGSERACCSFQFVGTRLDDRLDFRAIDGDLEGVCAACDTVTLRTAKQCGNCGAEISDAGAVKRRPAGMGAWSLQPS